MPSSCSHLRKALIFSSLAVLVLDHDAAGVSVVMRRMTVGDI
jgi:hypothetical protein